MKCSHCKKLKRFKHNLSYNVHNSSFIIKSKFSSYLQKHLKEDKLISYNFYICCTHKHVWDMLGHVNTNLTICCRLRDKLFFLVG